jgi:hypothetical protein
MERYFDVIRRALERRGGTVDKFIGDAAMGVRRPILHEDDALRAPRAAVEMREALHDLNKTLMPCDGTSEPHIDGRRETEPSGVLACRRYPTPSPANQAKILKGPACPVGGILNEPDA